MSEHDDAELAGAKATIEHLTEAMSWVSGHDRQGLDHLAESMEASAQRDAAEAERDQARHALAAEKSAHAALRRRVSIMHVWTNEDGVRFVYAVDILAALAPEPTP